MTYVLRVGASVSQIKALMRCMRYSYTEDYESNFKSLVSEFAQQGFKERMQDSKNYHESLTQTLKSIKEVLRT